MDTLEAIKLRLAAKHGHGCERKAAEAIGYSYGYVRLVLCGARKSVHVLDKIKQHLEETDDETS